MAKGKSIVLTVEPKGNFGEGKAAEAVSPGQAVAIDAAVEPVSGRHSLNADGTLAVGIAYNDYLQGKTNADAYAIGDRVLFYTPQPGDECNVLFKASEGAQAIGDEVGPEAATGDFIAAGTGWVVMETITVTAAVLVHCRKL